MTDALISQFCELTGAAPHEAEPYLAANSWDISSAVTEYFAAQEEASSSMGENEAPNTEAGVEEPVISRGGDGGGRRLGDIGSTDGGRSTAGVPASPAPSSQPAASSSRQGAARNPRRGIATLSDLSRDAGHAHGGGGGGGGGSGNDDDDDDEDSGGQDFFAGGEKSGLAVHTPADPRKTVKGILERARKNMAARGEAQDQRQSQFTGTGHTLGSDDTPSQTIPDPNAEAPPSAPRVSRTLHFWRDGFSVEDGPLHRFDDPASAPVLALIQTGRAPLAIMGVEPEQPVDVTVTQHEGDYVQPKKKYKPFSSGGQRLGSPTPTITSLQQSSPPPPQQQQQQQQQQRSSASASTSSSTAAVNVDMARPHVSLQIRLGDGTRLVSRFNTDHTIGDVYDFVQRASSASAARPWVLMTTFPSRELTDKSATLASLPEFSRGGVVVQKWQ